MLKTRIFDVGGTAWGQNWGLDDQKINRCC